MSGVDGKIFKAMDQIRLDKSISNACGVTMNESVESRAIAEAMAQCDNVTVTYLPAMIRIDGSARMKFDMSEISEILGRTMTSQLFEVCISTHYGRMVLVDENVVMLFGDMDEALDHIGR